MYLDCAAAGGGRRRPRRAQSRPELDPLRQQRRFAGGIIHGSPIPSDTLAPALLVAMAYLVHTGLSARRTGHGD